MGCKFSGFLGKKNQTRYIFLPKNKTDIKPPPLTRKAVDDKCIGMKLLCIQKKTLDFSLFLALFIRSLSVPRSKHQ
jgi:hypothetical protein